MIDDRNERFDALLREYRDGLPDPEPSPEFMPRVWERIESRRSFNRTFGRLSQLLMTGAALGCLVVGLLTLGQLSPPPSSYVEALADDNGAASVAYLDVLHGAPLEDN